MTQTVATGKAGQSIENFFENLFEGAITDVKKLLGEGETEVLTIEHKISIFGNSVVNEYRKIAANPEVATLADWFVKIAEGIDPALTPLISGIELQFPKIVNIATGVLGEIDKPIGEQLGDGLAKIESTKVASEVLGSNVLGGINAAVQDFVISNNATSVQPATPAQLITASQVVHAQAA